MFRVNSWRDIAWHSCYLTLFGLAAQGVLNYFLLPPDIFRAYWWVGALITLLLAPSLAALVAADLMRLSKLEAELKQRLAHDELTGLLNRRNLADRRAELTALSGILFFVDIDNFKQLNDQHGHDVGDEILCQVADCLRIACREEDIIVRYGGDEFLIISPGLEEGQVPELAERMLCEVRARCRVSAVEGTTGVTVSAGWVRKPVGVPLRDLVKQADQGLYGAKAAGRDQVVPAPSMRPDALSA